MTLRLDHFFVLTDFDAPAASLLTSLGFAEGARNSHEGQGTACRRFFFTNTMLELLYLRDTSEALQGPGRGLKLAERWETAGASPFGLIFHYPEQRGAGPGFATWRYRAAYLPSGVSMEVAESCGDTGEPLIVIVPRMPGPGVSRSTKNPNSLNRLTLTVPGAAHSGTLTQLVSKGLIDVRTGDDHLLEAEFDAGAAGLIHDLRPSLPLVIRC
jgi:hypothetical protein